MPASYNGAPAFEDLRNVSPFSVTLPDGAISFPQGVLDDPNLRRLFTYTVQQWDARVEKLPIKPAIEVGYWGAEFRPNRNNPSQLSCHSSGTAIDVWAVEHPNRLNTLTPDEKITLMHMSHEMSHEIRFGVPGLVCEICGRMAGWLDGSTADNMHAEARRYDPEAWAAAVVVLGLDTPKPPVVPPKEMDMTPAQVAKMIADRERVIARDVIAPEVDNRVAKLIRDGYLVAGPNKMGQNR